MRATSAGVMPNFVVNAFSGAETRPAGSASSTAGWAPVEGLARRHSRVMRTKTSGKIVPPRLAEEMTTMTPQSDSTFGLGLVSYDGSCGTFYGHEGNISGTVSIPLADGDGAWES
jgi:hypothetical protein